jgi:hypothetical protein
MSMHLIVGCGTLVRTAYQFLAFTFTPAKSHEGTFPGDSGTSAPLSYTILLEDLLGINKWSQKHGGSYAIAMTTGP